jgi:hypothetical protein
MITKFVVLVVACVNGQCEPLIFQKNTRDYYTHYDYEMGNKPITDWWCKNSLAEYHLRDIALVSSETKDIYYLDPKLVGFRGATYLPDSVQCWPTLRGPQ